MIRQATTQDLPAIVHVHRVCFANSYSSQLSHYQSVIGGGDLLGFCMGYYMDKDDQMQNFLHNNRIKVIWKTMLLMLTGNKPTWNKVLARFKHRPSVSDWVIVNDKYEQILNSQRGDLLSVCVLPDCRGKGYAQDMMEKFLAAMKERGRRLCLLSVETNNLRARRYYERNGFELYRKRGGEGLTYMKLL